MALVSVSDKVELNANIVNMKTEFVRFFLVSTLLVVVTVVLLLIILVMNGDSKRREAVLIDGIYIENGFFV